MVNIMYYLTIFFFYSILGYIMETSLSFLMDDGFTSGILYGPWTPLYGFGALIIIFLSKKLFKNLHMNRIIETIIIFLIVTSILTLIEFISGNLIEKILNMVYWDYSDLLLHFGKYICLPISLIWGTLSIIFIYIINPLFRNIINKIPNYVTIIILICFIIDIISTIIVKFN